MNYIKFIAAFLIGALSRFRNGEVRHVVFVTTLKMGDMVCMTPLFRAVKNAYPNARVTVFGDLVHRDLLQHSPDVDEVILFTQKDWWQTSKIIRRMNPSHGVMIDPNVYGLGMLLLSRLPVSAPRIIGYSPYATKMYRLLSLVAATRPVVLRKYMPSEYLRLLEPLQIVTDNTKKVLAHSKHADEAATELLKDYPRPWVGYLPSAGHQAKCWAPERFRVVIENTLRTHGGTAFVFGGPKDMEIVEKVIVPNDQRIVHVETETVDLLKATVSRLDLMVGTDTGPIYVAEAYGIPTVDIVGPVDENVQPPRGMCHAIVLPRGEREAQMFILNSRSFDPVEVKRQLDATEIEDVVAAIDGLMATCIHL